MGWYARREYGNGTPEYFDYLHDEEGIERDNEAYVSLDLEYGEEDCEEETDKHSKS